MTTDIKYFRHIDGLRAIAVLTVVLFHFEQPFFSGGYIGVDVFFVISGFLITRLILDEIDTTGSFSFRKFYSRRIRRLLPALLAVLAVSLCFALWLLSPDQLTKFARSLVSALFSVSNILFWSESGYFEDDAILKPLLHTWSLSVEEQFYLIWPTFLLLILSKLSNKSRVIALIILGAVSLGLNIAWIGANFDTKAKSTLFFLTPFRIFELTLGALGLYLMRYYTTLKRPIHEFSMLCGLIMILVATISFNDSLLFPSFYALLPCLGSLLIIVSTNAVTVRQLLTNRLAVAIGLISYSMYLVHWPLVSFYKQYTFSEIGPVEFGGLFLTTIILSCLLYHFIEQPFRRPRVNKGTNPLLSFTAGMTLIITAITLTGSYLMIDQDNQQKNKIVTTDNNKNKPQKQKALHSYCNLARSPNLRACDFNKEWQILVFGNSHEPDGRDIFSKVYENNHNLNIISYGTTNYCNLKLVNGKPFSKFKKLNCIPRAQALNNDNFINNLDGIIFSTKNPFKANKEEMWKILEYIQGKNPNISIIVLGDFLGTKTKCKELIHRFKTPNSCKDSQHLEFIGTEDLKEKKPTFSQNVKYTLISKYELACKNSDPSSCTIEINGSPAFLDKHHLTLPFSKYLGVKIREQYESELPALGFPAPVLKARQ